MRFQLPLALGGLAASLLLVQPNVHAATPATRIQVRTTDEVPVGHLARIVTRIASQTSKPAPTGGS